MRGGIAFVGTLVSARGQAPARELLPPKLRPPPPKNLLPCPQPPTYLEVQDFVSNCTRRYQNYSEMKTDGALTGTVSCILEIYQDLRYLKDQQEFKTDPLQTCLMDAQKALEQCITDITDRGAPALDCYKNNVLPPLNKFVNCNK